MIQRFKYTRTCVTQAETTRDRHIDKHTETMGPKIIHPFKHYYA